MGGFLIPTFPRHLLRSSFGKSIQEIKHQKQPKQQKHELVVEQSKDMCANQYGKKQKNVQITNGDQTSMNLL